MNHKMNGPQSFNSLDIDQNHGIRCSSSGSSAGRNSKNSKSHVSAGRRTMYPAYWPACSLLLYCGFSWLTYRLQHHWRVVLRSAAFVLLFTPLIVPVKNASVFPLYFFVFFISPGRDIVGLASVLLLFVISTSIVAVIKFRFCDRRK